MSFKLIKLDFPLIRAFNDYRLVKSYTYPIDFSSRRLGICADWIRNNFGTHKKNIIVTISNKPFNKSKKFSVDRLKSIGMYVAGRMVLNKYFANNYYIYIGVR